MLPSNAVHKVLRAPEFIGLTPQQINAGRCGEFADRLGELVQASFVDNRHSEHSFLRVGSKCFDAETPDGVAGFKNLPFFKRLYGKTHSHPRS